MQVLGFSVFEISLKSFSHSPWAVLWTGASQSQYFLCFSLSLSLITQLSVFLISSEASLRAVQRYVIIFAQRTSSFKKGNREIIEGSIKLKYDYFVHIFTTASSIFCQVQNSLVICVLPLASATLNLPFKFYGFSSDGHLINTPVAFSENICFWFSHCHLSNKYSRILWDFGVWGFFLLLYKFHYIPICNAFFNLDQHVNYSS